MNIYVGNMSPETTDDSLRQAFETCGQVESVNIIKDKFSGESRGFGFVQMPSKDEAQAALTNMNGHNLDGNTIKVAEAKPRVDRPRGGGSRGRPGGPRGGGGGYGRGGSGGSSRGGGGGRERRRF